MSAIEVVAGGNGVIEVLVPGPQGQTGNAGPGLPAGGTQGQMLVKASAADYDSTWVPVPQNLPLATQAEAQAGTNNSVVMTPLRTSEHVSARLYNGLDSTSNTLALTAAQGKVLQDGKVATSRQVLAGTGLSGGGNLTADRTLAVAFASQLEAEAGTATGVVMSPLRTAQQITSRLYNGLDSTSGSMALTAAQGKALQDGKVATSRQVLAGTGLSGGGDLSADRTLAVAFASQLEAEGGTATGVVMSPLRTAQQIASRGALFGTSPATNNSSGANAFKVFTTNAMAENAGGAVALGGTAATDGSLASFAQVAGRKTNATSGSRRGYLQVSVNDGSSMVERLRVTDSEYILPSGSFLSGTTARFATPEADGVAYGMDGNSAYIAGIGVTGLHLSAWGNTQTDRCATAVFCRSKTGTTGQFGLPQANDYVGRLDWTIGSSESTQGLCVRAVACVDGTPSSSSTPGRFVLMTTGSGTRIPQERWRVTQDGVIVYSQPLPAEINMTATATIAHLKTGLITSNATSAVTITLPTGTNCDGGFSGPYNSMAFEWTLMNLSANDVLIAGNTGHGVFGISGVGPSRSGCFVTRRTVQNAWVTYQTAG